VAATGPLGTVGDMGLSTDDTDRHDGPAADTADTAGDAHSGGWAPWRIVVLVAVVAITSAVVAAAWSGRDSAASADSVDVGFLADMTLHHEQAVQLGLLGVDRGTDHDVNHFAQEAIVAQRWELGYMAALLEEAGAEPSGSDSTVMSWMGMPTAAANMPGMASDAQMKAFADMSGTEADLEFLELMSEHHRGGLHMADYAAANADDPRVRDLAARMAKNQAAELREYAAVEARLRNQAGAG
jgi:uncharacterized protein (DUF305 family)